MVNLAQDENGEVYLIMPTIHKCECGKQMLMTLCPIPGHKAFVCDCGRSKLEQINPLAAAMQGLSAMLKANGIDVDSMMSD